MTGRSGVARGVGFGGFGGSAVGVVGFVGAFVGISAFGDFAERLLSLGDWEGRRDRVVNI